MLPIGENPIERRPGEKSALRPGLPGTLVLIVGVEAIVERLIEQRIASQIGRQDKGFEKPSCMSEMPFGRTGVFHRLDDHVFGAERSRKFDGKSAGFKKTVAQGAVGARRKLRIED